MRFFPTKARLAHIVFESDDRASKNFDIVLLILILGSVAITMLDSVREIRNDYGYLFWLMEWGITILFTIEYGMRVWLSSNKKGYIFSFYGLVDLLGTIPAYLSLIVVNTQYLIVIRSLRLLRVIRILKLGRYISEAEFLTQALYASRAKIQLFVGSVLSIVLIMGTVMYIVEGPESGYTSIPMSMYWAIVTLTTVGFGDITPLTPIGKFLASIIMLLGYAIIAVPTGIVTSELTAAKYKNISPARKACPTCDLKDHDRDADYCKFCGSRLERIQEPFE